MGEGNSSKKIVKKTTSRALNLFKKINSNISIQTNENSYIMKSLTNYKAEFFQVNIMYFLTLDKDDLILYNVKLYNQNWKNSFVLNFTGRAVLYWVNFYYFLIFLYGIYEVSLLLAWARFSSTLGAQTSW